MRLTGIIDLPTIAALRALEVVYQDNDKVYVPNVGFFDWDPFSNAADDGATIVKPTVVAGAGRWVIAAGFQNAPGALIAANACVGTPILVPSGNFDDVRTVGEGGAYATLAAAMSDATVVDGTILKFVSDVVDTTTVTLSRAVVVDLAGFTHSNATSVNQISITVPLVVIKNGTIHQTKVANTSVETVISTNVTAPGPVFIFGNTIKVQEFGILARGATMIEGNHFEYVGASLTNSHRFIALYTISGETRIHKNTFLCSTRPSTTRYSNFVFIATTAGAVWNAPLFVSYNTQTGGDLRQFVFNESLVPTSGSKLIVAGNTFNDFNGGVGLISPALYNGLDEILIADNVQGGDAAGNFKGVFFVDGSSGTLDADTVLHYGGNTTEGGALRVDYTSMARDSENILARRAALTQAGDLVQSVTIPDALQEAGLLLQDLKARRTYIVDNDGNPVPGSGTAEDPYVVGTGDTEVETVTTSLTPVVYDTVDGWVPAQADADENVAKLIQLDDGTNIAVGKVTWTGHGLDIGAIYYLDQATAGGYVTPAPTSGLSQQLFVVEDADTIHVDLEEAAVVGETASTPSISYQANSDTFPADPKRADTLYVTTDGTRTGTVTEEWVYDGVGWTFVGGSVAVSGAVIDNTIADSALVTTVGRYIVPATGTAGAFVGQENQYVDWAGDLDETDPANPIPINFTFSAPTDGDKVAINAGTNAGTIWAYDGTVWTQQAGTVGVPAAGQLLTITNLATITSAGSPDSPWSNVVGGQFTIPSAGKWDVEYTLAFTNSTTNWVQTRIVDLAGIEVFGSRNAFTPTANNPTYISGNIQIDLTAANTYRLQARTFNGSTLTINNPTATTGAAAQRGQSVIKWTKVVEFPPVAVDPSLVIPQTLSRMVVNYSASSTGFPNPGVAPIGVNATPQITGSRFALDGNIVVVAAGGRVRLTGPTSGSFNSTGTAVFHWALEGQTAKYQPAGAVNATGLILSANAATPAPEAQAILEFTPTTNVRLQLYVTSSSGVFIMSTAYSVITCEELPTMTVTGTVDPTLVPVNDQSSSGYFDIGTTRYQFGVLPNTGATGFRTLTFPQPFANASYGFSTATAYVDATPRITVFNTPTATSIQLRVQAPGGSESSAEVRWTAIGRKP